MQQILTAIILFLVIPAFGVAFFLNIYIDMKARKVVRAPVPDLFLVFATYGGLVILILTALIGEWSGLASLGTVYLGFGAPIVMGCIMYRQKKNLSVSQYHLWTFRVALLYFVVAPSLFIFLFLAEEWLMN